MSKVPLEHGTYRLSQIGQYQHNDLIIVLHDKKAKTCLLINMAVPDDSNINTKETEKLMKYKDQEDQERT